MFSIDPYFFHQMPVNAIAVDPPIISAEVSGSEFLSHIVNLCLAESEKSRSQFFLYMACFIW